ncbi:MAG: hypothetical protein AAFO75_08850 [Pseudomonadota bacterium]
MFTSSSQKIGIFFGFYPAPLLDVMAVSVKELVSNYQAAIQEATALATP